MASQLLLVVHGSSEDELERVAIERQFRQRRRSRRALLPVVPSGCLGCSRGRLGSLFVCSERPVLRPALPNMRARESSTQRPRLTSRVAGASQQTAMRPEPRTDRLARPNPPIARGRGAATRNQLPVAGAGAATSGRRAPRDDRQSVGLQRQQRGRDELDTACPWLGAPPGDRDGTNRLGVVGVLGVAQRHQDRSLLDRHPVRNCNGRSRRRPQSDLSGPTSTNRPPHSCSDFTQPP